MTFNLVVNAFGGQQILPTTIEIAGCAPSRVTITRTAAWQDNEAQNGDKYKISNIHNKGSEDHELPDFEFSPSYCGFEKFSVVNAAGDTADFSAVVQIASALTTNVDNHQKKIRFPNDVLGKKEVTLTVHAIGGQTLSLAVTIEVKAETDSWAECANNVPEKQDAVCKVGGDKCCPTRDSTSAEPYDEKTAVHLCGRPFATSVPSFGVGSYGGYDFLCTEAQKPKPPVEPIGASWLTVSAFITTVMLLLSSF